MHIEKLNASLGAQAHGVDLSTPLDDTTFATLERAFYEHSVLLVRDQSLSPEQQVGFSRRFGTLERHVFSHWCLADVPEVLIVSNVQSDGEPVGVYNAGKYWHTDLSYMSAPSCASVLHAIEVPHDGVHTLGDTYFASTTSAYAALSAEVKGRIASLRAEFSLDHQRSKLRADGDHNATLTESAKAKTPAAYHRVVQTHAVTGKQALYVNEGHTTQILDVSKAESDALLAALCAHITQPDFVYRHQWRVGDVLMWDNAATQHLATFDYALPQRRYMHRTTITGAQLD